MRDGVSSAPSATRSLHRRQLPADKQHMRIVLRQRYGFRQQHKRMSVHTVIIYFAILEALQEELCFGSTMFRLIPGSILPCVCDLFVLEVSEVASFQIANGKYAIRNRAIQRFIVFFCCNID